MKEGDGKMEYVPNRVEVKRNEQIRFVLKNAGELAHEFVLASTADNLKHAALMQKYPDMEHDDPNGKTLQPKANSEILWRFTKRGEFEFGCLIPGHREAGMTGKDRRQVMLTKGRMHEHPHTLSRRRADSCVGGTTPAPRAIRVWSTVRSPRSMRRPARSRSSTAP